MSSNDELLNATPGPCTSDQIAVDYAFELNQRPLISYQWNRQKSTNSADPEESAAIPGTNFADGL
jgi:predicted porin